MDKIKEKGLVYNMRRNIRLANCNNRDAYMYYNPILQISINMHDTCHLRAMQALAWVRMALPRGLACHVASTWVPRKNKPLFALF